MLNKAAFYSKTVKYYNKKKVTYASDGKAESSLCSVKLFSILKHHKILKK